MTPDQIAFQVGPVIFRWYGLLVAAGAVLGAWIAAHEAERRGINPDHIWNSLTFALILGILGARLYHVLSDPVGQQASWQYYLIEEPFIPVTVFGFQFPFPNALAIWRGGLGIYGGIIGGLIAVVAYARYYNLNLTTMLDVGAVGLLLGQAIGRWGNFFNQELYGYPTTLPWGIPIEQQNRLPQFADLPASTRFHPSFLYESLWALAGVAIMLWLTRRFSDRLRSGDLVLFYLIWYPAGRFLVEFQRPDAWTVAGLPAAQWIAIFAIALGAAGLWWRHREPFEPLSEELESPMEGLSRAERRRREREKRKSNA